MGIKLLSSDCESERKITAFTSIPAEIKSLRKFKSSSWSTAKIEKTQKIKTKTKTILFIQTPYFLQNHRAFDRQLSRLAKNRHLLFFGLPLNDHYFLLLKYCL